MSRQERIKIQAKNIDAAAGEILGVLEDTSKGNVVYFGGWHGFGASAALKVVAQRLKSSKSKFDKVIHVDCSVWKSMRALQKAVAEELELPQSVMAIFNRHDEEDDFNGVEQGSRGFIEDIRVKIFRMLVNSTFVVIFHNGSKQCIDLYECGVPVLPYLENKMLWTWHGRFRLYLKLEDLDLEHWELDNMHRLTDVCLHTSLGYETEELRDLVYVEAEEVAKCLGIAEPDYMNHKVVRLCILYAWAVRRTISPTVVDMNTHAPNCWICDGIIQGEVNTAWEIGDSLQRNMCLDWFGTTINRETICGDYPEGKNELIWFDKKIIGTAKNRYSPEDLAFLRQKRSMRKELHEYLQESTTDQLALLLTDLAPEANRWDFTTHQELLKDSTRVLSPDVTSCFIFSQEEPRKTTSIILPVGMFQHSQSRKLRVLHLSQCTFSFASPPFLCCKQLRFLLLDHCTNTAGKDQPSHTEDISCFQKLWVLDLRYTYWYWLLSENMKSLMADLRELNVEGVKLGSIRNLCGGRPSLVILRATDSLVPTEEKDTNNQAPFPIMSSANGLQSSSLINDVLPSSLESFSFINKAETYTEISSISFRGCSRLKSILFRGDLWSLKDLDLTGTAVKTLDLRHVLNLKRLILLGCENLCAILWPMESFYNFFLRLKVLHISTIRSASSIQSNWEEKGKEANSATRSSSILSFAAREEDMSRDASFEFRWHISVRDARLLRSLEPFFEKRVFNIYVVIDSSRASRVSAGGSKVSQGIMSLQQPDHYLYARDVIFQGHLEDGAGNKDTTSWIWSCPPGPTPFVFASWYIHIQDEEEMQQQQSIFEGTSTSTALPPSYISDTTCMLHVHDSQFITHIPWPQNSFWESLEWCRVERCPELCSVFATTQESGCKIFCELATFWASQLSMACYIWNWRGISQIDGESFRSLAFLHLDYCPRLIHVLPLSVHIATLPRVETLEIVCCGDLREVFPLDPKRQDKQEIIEFPELRRIHLYELPVLQHICGSRMFAPKLETVKIRGCWNLRRLPTVSGNTTNQPKVDCEKDWWDNLEWDGVEMNHHPSLYEPTHSRYYKKSHLSRGTVLR
uniref:Uncharacterized protein n=1 Tax=Avena sativa TaxID=4498 RepID=A0ACD5Z0S8_AVESA